MVALFIVDTTSTRCRCIVFAVGIRSLEVDSHLGNQIHNTVPITAYFPNPEPDGMVYAKMVVKFLEELVLYESKSVGKHSLEAQSVWQSFAKAKFLRS